MVEISATMNFATAKFGAVNGQIYATATKEFNG